MSAVERPGTSDSVRAQPRGGRLFVLAGLVVAVHLAGLAVLLTEEYGPFAVTLAMLAWIFVNCLLLVVLQRPGVCAALALGLIVVLIELSRFKFGILQLTLTFLDFLIIDRDTFSFLLSVFPRLQMQLLIAAPEVARAEGNTTYRLVRRVNEQGREEVLVTGRRTSLPEPPSPPPEEAPPSPSDVAPRPEPVQEALFGAEDVA